jgi:hypothetical protein
MKGSFIRGLSPSLTLHSFSVTLFALGSLFFFNPVENKHTESGFVDRSWSDLRRPEFVDSPESTNKYRLQNLSIFLKNLTVKRDVLRDY